MASFILTTLIWVVVIGFLTFVIFYVILKPWRDPMGKHILFFMLAFLVAFIYSLIAPHIPHGSLIHGWIVVIAGIAVVVWWRVALLVKYQMQNHEALYDIWKKITRK